MDIWVVAAAAGAGYVAQHCKNFIKGKPRYTDSSNGTSSFVRAESSPIRQHAQDKSCLPSIAVDRKKQGEEACSGRNPALQDSSMAEMASTSRLHDEDMVMLDGFANCSTICNSNSLPGFLNNVDVQGDLEGVGVGTDIYGVDGDLPVQPSTREMGVNFGFARKKSSLRSRRTSGQFIKPLSSLESCLMVQLYKEEIGMKEYTFSSMGSPRTPTFRPFLVTDGSRIISSVSSDHSSSVNGAVQNKMCKKPCSQEKTTIFGCPRLPSIGSMELQKKAKSKTRLEPGENLSCSCKTANTKPQRFQGLYDGGLLFFLGISIGIISSLLVNKREVDKLNELLKQSENLVQDLQDELEMKDTLTVKELTVEDYESQDTQNDLLNHGALHAFASECKQDKCNKKHHERKAEEEPFSKIEAELEAELERLEFGINSCSLKEKLQNVVELDPDQVPDVAVGELKADVFGRRGDTQPYADRDGSGSSTPHSANYAVSPRELSLRLHEVIQSRLEKRVEELETALQNSQRKVQNGKLQHSSYWREFSNNESGSSSVQGSPVVKQQNHADEPVVINLSGDALDAYHEAYDEFTKMNELEDVDTPSGVKDSLKHESLQTFTQSAYWLPNGGRVHSNTQRNSFTDKGTMLFSTEQKEDDILLSNDIIASGDDSDSGHDEMEKFLIQQIVEKARKGSPVVLNAQRALFARDENEH